MTTVTSDTEGSTSSAQVIELEKELRALVKDRKVFHQEVRVLRNKLREKYVEIILTDPEACEKNDTPTSLWNYVYYIMIDEFRNRIKYTANDQSVPPASKSQRMLKLLADQRSFISGATRFYTDLILKLKMKYGLHREGQEFEVTLLDSVRLKEFRRVCHRFYINLGDLARYRELLPDGEARVPDWKVPAEYYYTALSLWSSTGHPHNQLAVLATYMKNDFLAVYHYFRSLGVQVPFETARGNLVILFDLNRQRHEEITEKKRATTKKGGRAVKDVAKSDNGESSEGEVKMTFFIRFVRLNGILFTRTSFETFSEVLNETLRDLEKLLCLDHETLESFFSAEIYKAGNARRGLSLGVLQLISIMIFSVPTGASRSSYADALQHQTIAKHAITGLLKLAGYIMSTCAESEDVEESPLLPACLVFMEWLASRPDVVAGISTDDERQSSERAGFWKDSLALLNKACDTDAYDNTSCVGVAHWEDRELAGFIPLSSIHAGLNFNKEHPSESRARLHRLVAAGKSIVKILDGSNAGLAFDDDVDMFYLSGQPRERRPKEKVQVQESKTHVQPAPFVPVEEDEEEVIVFKPLIKVASESKISSGETDDHRPIALAPTPSDFYGMAAIQNEPYRPPGAVEAYRPPAVEAYRPPPAVETYRPPPPAVEVKPDTSFGSFGLPSDVEFNKSFASMGMTPSSTMSSYSSAGLPYYDQALTPGMNGQQASMDNGSFGTNFSSRYASLGQDLLYRLSAAKASSFTDSSTAPLSDIEYAQLTRESAPPRTRPVVPPPPGFGPLPKRAVSNQNLPMTSSSAWMDNSFQSGGRPVYPNNPIWSYNNGLPVPKSAAYPFPGMGVHTLQHLEQQQLPVEQQQPVQSFMGTWNPEPSVPAAPQQPLRPYLPPDVVS